MAGINYDVGLDTVLGVSYIHRDLGRGVIRRRVGRWGQLLLHHQPRSGRRPEPRCRAAAQHRHCAGGCDRQTKGQRRQRRRRCSWLRSACRAIRLPAPSSRAVRLRRAVFSVNKRLSDRFSVLGSHTYSRTIGNYPVRSRRRTASWIEHLVAVRLIDLLANRSDPLPTDRPATSGGGVL